MANQSPLVGRGHNADCHKLLEKIPSVKQLWVGRPAKEATPDLASKDYDVALTIAFENYDGLKSYIDHDLHKQFIARNKEHWQRVQIYDFVH